MTENQTHDPSSREQRDEDMVTDCIEKCVECYAVCTQTASYAIEAGATFDSSLVTLLQDCAEICQTSANFMLRDSDNHAKTCAVCAEICTLCAEACEAEAEDELMKACAEICRECAQSCTEMSSGKDTSDILHA